MKQKALTLIEMVVVVAIIAILAMIVIKLAGRIDNQGKEWRIRNAFALLDAALGEFQDYGYNYKGSDYAEFDFPLDCNDFDTVKLEGTLKKALNAESVSINGGVHELDYSGSEALYFFLRRIPESRKTLAKINNSLITSEDSEGDNMEINVDGRKYLLLRIIDPWGETLRYSYYKDENKPKERRNFPVIISSGPDRIFGTNDDITNR